jgi:hypothetical protein
MPQHTKIQTGSKVIGIDEISVRKRHVYRIVVSDLERSLVQSGLAARTAASRAWTSSMYFLGKRRPKRYARP